jgi:predicted transcriptional regulator
MIELALVNWDYVTSIMISFGITAIFTTLYNKNKHLHTSKVDTNEPIVEAIVAEYSRRLKYIEKMMVELGIRIDKLEVHKGSTDTANESHIHYITSQRKSQVPQEYITSIPSQPTSPVVGSITPIIDEKSTLDIQNGTMEYILKLLNERPRSSREIQSSIGRTREHTSRLMKKLYEANLVDRQSNSRPYKYTITHAGRVKINVQSDKNSSSENENIQHRLIDIQSPLRHNNSEYQ